MSRTANLSPYRTFLVDGVESFRVAGNSPILRNSTAKQPDKHIVATQKHSLPTISIVVAVTLTPTRYKLIIHNLHCVELRCEKALSSP